MGTANEIQHGGDHYKSVVGIQHWDLMADNNVPYLEGNASKYGYRWPKKNGLEDLQKFQHYVQKVLEKHLMEEYPSTSQMSAPSWYAFCQANGVDALTTEATWLILSWSTEKDLLACLDLISMIISKEESRLMREE